MRKRRIKKIVHFLYSAINLSFSNLPPLNLSLSYFLFLSHTLFYFTTHWRMSGLHQNSTGAVLLTMHDTIRQKLTFPKSLEGCHRFNKIGELWVTTHQPFSFTPPPLPSCSDLLSYNHSIARYHYYVNTLPFCYGPLFLPPQYKFQLLKSLFLSYTTLTIVSG